MTPTTKQTRIVAIGDPGPTQQQIVTALSSNEEFILVDILTTPDRLAREIRAAEPDIILLDSELGGQPTLDIIDDIALQYPEIAIIAILPNEDPLRAQQVMLAGARGFLIQPFTQINLLSTLRRIRDLETRRLSSQTIRAGEKADVFHPIRIVSIFSPRGGVGCSTLATNLAIAIKEKTNGRVLLLEGKLFFGHLGLILNLRNQNTLADLIPHSHNLDENLVADVVVGHATGIDVLLGPRDIQVAQGVRPDDLYNILVGIQRFYDFIVIDAGSALTDNTVTLLDASDRIMLITNPDLASLQDTSRFITLSQSLSYPADKMLVVLNRAGTPGGVRQKDIEAALHAPLFAQIPTDDANALRCLNRGIPILYRYPRSPVSKGIKALAETLLAQGASEISSAAQPKPVDRTQRDALLASSRLG